MGSIITGGYSIDFSLNEYSAEIDKFVNRGMIQQEYLVYLNRNTQPPASFNAKGEIDTVLLQKNVSDHTIK